MATLKATQDLSVAGEVVEAGDTFEASDQEATILVARGLAEVATDKKGSRKL